jgi:DNA-directed RNA polymerase subunit omega
MINSDSMINPPIVDLLDKATTKYALVVSTSKRARKLIDGEPTVVDKKFNKPLTTAINEINEENVLVENPTEEQIEERI